MEVLKRNDLRINIVLQGSSKIDFRNANTKTICITVNTEHSLIKKGKGFVYPITGTVSDGDGDYYYARLDNIEKYNESYIVIDYSAPNIHNFVSSKQYEQLVSKFVHVSASLYTTNYFVKEGRDLDIVTTFLNCLLPRRDALIKNMKERELPHTNINGVYDKTALQDMYKRAKILVNIHQLKAHHTLEELRVISALQCGVVVVCEYSPLLHLVPFQHLIVWSSYETIVDKIQHVYENYDEYHAKIFGGENAAVLHTLHDRNVSALEKKILEV